MEIYFFYLGFRQGDWYRKVSFTPETFQEVIGIFSSHRVLSWWGVHLKQLYTYTSDRDHYQSIDAHDLDRLLAMVVGAQIKNVCNSLVSNGSTNFLEMNTLLRVPTIIRSKS